MTASASSLREVAGEADTTVRRVDLKAVLSEGSNALEDEEGSDRPLRPRR